MLINLNPMTGWIAKVHLYIIAALAATSLLLGIGFYVQGQRMHSAKVELKAEKAARKADRKSYKQAQREATLLALAQKKSMERKYDDYKKDSDRHYVDLRRLFDAALVRYKATQRPSSRPVSLPAASAAGPGSPEGAGQDTFVPIPMNDLAICAENTAKAMIAHDWATKVGAAQADQ